MIEYKLGYFGISRDILFEPHGSVVHKALMWAVPNTIVAVGLFWYWGAPSSKESNAVSNAWTGYTFALAFLLAFRLQQGQSRFWESASLCNEMRGEWFEATGSLFAFTTKDPDRRDEADKFRSFLIGKVSKVMKGIPIDKIEMMIDFNVVIEGDFEADFSPPEKCNEKFADVDVRCFA